jgi:hypothetical protein
MIARGLYRATMPDGAECAVVEYGAGSGAGEIPRAHYEDEGYEPPFDSLPTKEQHEAQQNATRT